MAQTITDKDETSRLRLVLVFVVVAATIVTTGIISHSVSHPALTISKTTLGSHEQTVLQTSNSGLINKLQADISTLPRPGNGFYNCPEDNGSSYMLAFANPKETVTVELTGCQSVTLSGSKIVYDANSKFLNDISSAVGTPIDPNNF